MPTDKDWKDRKSIRLDHWDYGWAGAYHITIVTANRAHFLGKVEANGTMHLSPIGEIAERAWNALPSQFPDLELGAYQFMPDHFHGILFLTRDHPQEAKAHQTPISVREGRYQNIGKHSVFSIIGAFKSAVTRHSKALDPEFGWQRRYHDRVIRNARELEAITKYIHENPMRWADRKSDSGR